MKTGDRFGGDPIDRLRAGAMAHRRPQKTRGCPDEDRLRLLLPGQIEPAEAEKLLTHAAECDWCGAVLREAAQDLSEPPAGEEEELAGKARLADPVRRQELVERIVRAKPPDPKPWFLRWPAWGFATAALVAALGGASYEHWVRSPARTGALLAAAYTKHRSMEMRLPGTAWGQERIQMGTGMSSSHEPPELLDATSNISRGLEAHPDDARWLQLEGRADLLEGKDSAIEELERARSLRPADATILVDLGAAYYQKAVKEDDPVSYSLAYQRLSEGLRLKPNDPTLLFDQALAAEHIQTPSVAQAAWDAYLKVDSTSNFAAEAHAHLDNIKKNWSNSVLTPTIQPPTR